MRAIYLIRHGEPQFPDQKRCCLGRLDLSLSEKGRSQAAMLQKALFPLTGAHILSSPLKRCTETAEAAGFGAFLFQRKETVPLCSFNVIDDFAEVDTGLWDGLTFAEIRQKWPVEYERRGVDEWNEPFPDGESLNDCFLRASQAMDQVFEKYPAGDLFIFAHRGVIQALYAHLTRKSRAEVLNYVPEYCKPVVLLMEDNTVLAEIVLDPENLPDPFPGERACKEILSSYGTPEPVAEHCMAVRKKTEQICESLNEKGMGLNIRAACSAAMLHDIARTEKRHAAAGAEYLFDNGYPAVAPLVGDHMELPAEEEYISEKSVVFLADKLIKDTRPVSLKERYLSGRDEKTLVFAREKYMQAERIFREFQELFPEPLQNDGQP